MTPYEQGYNDYFSRRLNNPYSGNTDPESFCEWESGYDDAKTEDFDLPCKKWDEE